MEIDDKTKEELLGVIKEVTLEMSKMDDSRDQIKEIINEASKTFGIDKSLLRKVSRFYHKKNISSFEIEAAEIKTVYNAITK